MKSEKNHENKRFQKKSENGLCDHVNLTHPYRHGDRVRQNSNKLTFPCRSTALQLVERIVLTSVLFEYF